MNQKQREALLKLWVREDNGQSFEEFLATAKPELFGHGCLLVPWCGMIVGVEIDGETHT